METPKDKPPEFFKSTKTSLKSILKHPEINTTKINDVVIKAHKIVIHTLQFLKLYILHHYETNNHILPDIDKVLILNVMKVVCGEKHTNTGKPPKRETIELKDKLTAFYTEHYNPYTQPEQLDYAYMSNVLSYLCEDIMTMYENNIQLHYVDYVERFVNVVWRKKMLVVKEKFQKQSIYYDLKCKPMDYFPCMVAIMKHVENDLETISNVFPLRSSIAPSYIRLDTITLVNMLLRKEQGKKSDYSNQGNTKKHEDKIWQFFFRTERKLFTKTGYSFHHMISTDGVGVSILFLRKDLVGNKIPNTKKNAFKELYIDELNDYSALQNKKIVGIDPGKEDLIYCVDDASKDANVFRYSQNQRRKETKMKKYNNIILAMKTNKIQGE
jgi:hypothetical protein